MRVCDLLGATQPARSPDLWYPDEDLIKYSIPNDVWFHVDNLSSAHVYLRMRENETWDKLPENLLTDCAQLVKANSIDGMSFLHSPVVEMVVVVWRCDVAVVWSGNAHGGRAQATRRTI